ncbi:hypothetical protein [Mesorhizobium caraganae]|uniref:AbiU2 domain-containing protein n=1 Tax=Mesorhizobium caraganae TaxID=483206 RepID=UPI003ECC5A93
MAKKKKRVTISTTEAVKRLDTMIPILYRNIQNALLIEAVLEVGNDIVGGMTDRTLPGARAFNRIMNSLAYDLAMHLSRLYDVGNRSRHVNRRDVASIPLAVRLFRQRRCEKVLCERARNWLSPGTSHANVFEQDCRNAIHRASKGYSATFRGNFGRSGLKTLKEFRDSFMAHSLMTETDANPIYSQLFRLTDCARDFVEDARLAVSGTNSSLDGQERLFAADAKRFWRLALLGKR